MLEELKEKVYEANMELVRKGLVIYTWGNVSGIDRSLGLVVIKPSGVDYDQMKPSDMVVVDLITGNVVEGDLKPSSDTPTHRVLYRAFPEVEGIVHTHSPWAVAYAQAGLPIPAYGTTHADYFYGDIPCTREMTFQEIEEDYEENTGHVIVETVAATTGVDRALDVPGILVRDHGPFTWGDSPDDAVYHAVVLEKVAEMAYHTQTLSPTTQKVSKALLEKHYERKHGANAYYGQDHHK